MTNSEIVLTKIGAYADDIDYHHLREVLTQVEYAFHQEHLPFIVTHADPIRVAIILAEWCLPVPLIEATMWSVAQSKGTLSSCISRQGEMLGALTYQLSRFYQFLIEVRSAQLSGRIKQENLSFSPQLFGKFLSPCFIILLLSIFLDMIRTAVQSSEASDRQLLAWQARTLFIRPIADRLGIWGVYDELQDLIFQCEAPERYAAIQHIMPLQQNLNTFADNISWQLQNATKDHAIAAWRVERLPTPYHQIDKFLQRRHIAYLSPQDVLSFAIILPDEQLCYRFLQALHAFGKAKTLLQNYHDAQNTYHSISTHLIMNGSIPVTLHLQTDEWYEYSRYGILYTWWQNKTTRPRVEHILPRPPVGEIIVYKDGKAYILPEQATPLDLARRISKRLARICTGAYVYGKGRVGADYRLANGDIVDLLQMYSIPANGTPPFAPASTSPSKKSPGSPPQPDSSDDLDPLAMNEGIDITDAIHITHLPYTGKRCYRCDRCKPYPPQPVIAYMTANNTLTIHQANCRAIQQKELAREVAWQQGADKSGTTFLQVEAWDQLGLLATIASSIAAMRINIVEVEARISTNGTFLSRFFLENVDQETADKLQHLLQQIHYVGHVKIHTNQAAHIPDQGIPTKWRINPYTLKPADETIFMGRKKEIQEIWRLLERTERVGRPGRESCNSIILWGQQRIGKTSLLMHLERRVREDPHSGFVPVRFSMMEYEEKTHTPGSDLIYHFVSQLERNLADIWPEWPTSLPPLEDKRWQDPQKVLMDYVYLIQHRLGEGKRLLVMFDEFQSLVHWPRERSQPLLDCLHEILSSGLGVSFIFAGWGLFWQHEMLSKISSFVFPIHIRTLAREDARDLICDPVSPRTYENDMVEQILNLTDCHPFYIHLLCHTIVENIVMNEPRREVFTQQDLDQAMRKLRQFYFQFYYYPLQAEKDGGYLLARLAQLVAAPNGYLRVETLMQSLEGSLSPSRIYEILHNLTTLEIVERSEHDQQAYRIRLPLLQLLLEKTNPKFLL